MGFFEAIEACLTNYAVFKGRAPRSEYWWFVIFGIVVNTVARLIPVLAVIVGLGLILPNLAVHVRRLHDIDRSGWYLLLPSPAASLTLIFLAMTYSTGQPVFGGLWIIFALITAGCYLILLIWCCLRGTVGPNRFGPDPFAFDPLTPRV
ncbi:MAG TPA: DUF805 domain-containing protein [Candidatus Binataceae bacterium]|nr:DUF805 domain-containing protein [Candidatus Binataceae bacterium]